MAQVDQSRLNASLRKVKSLHGIRQTAKAIATAINNMSETDVALSDVTTGDVSTSRHGFAPKAPNDANKFLDGTGVYSVPNGNWDSVVILGSDVTTTNTTATDITDFTFAGAANSVYGFEVVAFGTSSSSAGIKFGIGFSSTGAGVTASVQVTNNSSTFGIGAFATLSASAVWTSTDPLSFCQMRGFFTTGANAGTFSIQHAKVTSGTSTIKKGSFFRVKQRA